VLEDSYPKC